MSRVLAFDFGLKYIGVAVGQTVTKTAQPLVALANNSSVFRQIEQLFAQWQPQVILIGLPLHMDGSEQPLTAEVKAFAENLKQCPKTNAPIEYVDERLSTWEAKQRLDLPYKGSIDKKQAHRLNTMAAVIIAEDWLNHPQVSAE